MLKSKENTLASLVDSSVEENARLAEILYEVADTLPQARFEKYLQDHPPSPRLIYYLMVKAQEGLNREKKLRASAIGKNAAHALHNQTGGSNDKQEKIRAVWATGDYKTKVECALKEHEKIGMSFDTAKKALRTPKPK